MLTAEEQRKFEARLALKTRAPFDESWSSSEKKLYRTWCQKKRLSEKKLRVERQRAKRAERKAKQTAHENANDADEQTREPSQRSAESGEFGISEQPALPVETDQSSAVPPAMDSTWLFVSACLIM